MLAKLYDVAFRVDGVTHGHAVEGSSRATTGISSDSDISRLGNGEAHDLRTGQSLSGLLQDGAFKP